MKKPQNIAASNRAKLLNLSRKTGQSFQELVQYFAMSRFLYRLSISSLSSRFILKGAMLLHAKNITDARSTLDIDLLGKLDNSPETVKKAMVQIFSSEAQDDGLEFLPETIDISDITKDSAYAGCRVNFRVMLDSIRIPMQVDIGFGDEVVPDPTIIDTPSLLDYPAGKLLGYALETSIAEKTHAMLKLEFINSRIKDFYDIWILSKQINFDDTRLIAAIIATFRKRQTIILSESVIFTDDFFNDSNKQKQWLAFCRKRDIKNAPDTFAEVAKHTCEFLKPLLVKAKLVQQSTT